ncbi:uncharacterized protein LOC111311001 [Durio zibethinus]|uniref:Uncharacterized protein LOC111311001 n=1 Tax=Durio zibethinus TaxID=66656 RepID=A0A6P6AMM1_DURZI|nr:uncharacterized protein LOC111311001 [Durio zibethinus]
MLRTKLAIYGLVALAAFSQVLDAVSGARQVSTAGCKPSSCGALTDISRPVRLKGDPPECGDLDHELACENDQAIAQNDEYRSFYVQDIFYDHSEIRLVDGSLDSHKCSILPKSLVSEHQSDFIYFLSCQLPMNSSLYVDASPCANASFSPHPYFYALFSGETLNATGFHESCTVEVQVPRPVRLRSSNVTGLGLSIFDVHQELLMGYDVPWDCANSYLSRNKISLRKM